MSGWNLCPQYLTANCEQFTYNVNVPRGVDHDVLVPSLACYVVLDDPI